MASPMCKIEKGVYLRKNNSGDTYVAIMQFNGKQKSKTFNTYLDAVNQRREWETEIQKPKTESKHSLCDSYCKDCKYSRVLNVMTKEIYCNYIAIKSESRGCQAGIGCDKKVKRESNHLELMRINYSDAHHYGRKKRSRRIRVSRNLIDKR